MEPNALPGQSWPNDPPTDVDALRDENESLRAALRDVKSLIPGFGTHSPMDYIKAMREISAVVGKAL